MKRKMILLALVFASFHLVFAQTEVRKPSVEIFINGKMYMNGDEITVQKGQVLELKASQKGGQRDFVNYPDTYLKMTPQIQVLSRGTDHLVYSENNIKTEWKLLSENVLFSSDNQISIKKDPTNSNEATARIGIGDFSRTYLKINLSTVWESSTGEEKKLEKNTCDALLYLNIEGSTTDTWYVSKNIHSLGTKNGKIANNLDMIQGNFDTIEFHLIHIKYNEIQKDIRNLQQNMNSLQFNLEQAKATNPAFNTAIHVLGLPSDRPIADLEIFDSLQQQWSQINTFIFQQASIMNSENADVDKLKHSIQKYLDWQYRLPDNWIVVLGLYVPQINSANIVLPNDLQLISDDSKIPDTSSFEQMRTFLNQRIQNIEIEKQQITQIKTRLQAVKLFDGMLRSYFSSINWIEWENTRKERFASAK